MADKGKSRVSPRERRFDAAPCEADIGPPAVTAAGVNGTRHEDWTANNSRRISLIAKRFSQGLTPEEKRELGVLQAEADRYLDEIAPLPFEHLDKLEERVRLLAADSAGSDEAPPDVP